MNPRFFVEEPTEAEIDDLRRRARSVAMTGVFVDPSTYVFSTGVTSRSRRASIQMLAKRQKTIYPRGG